MGIFDAFTGKGKLKQELQETKEQAGALSVAVKALQSRAFESSLSRQIFPNWKVFKELEAFRIQDDVSSIVNRLAQTSARLPIYAYDTAGEDMPANKLTAFLATLTYTKRLQLYTYLYLLDECFIYKERIEFGSQAGVQAAHFLHPQMMTVVISDAFPHNVIGYKYNDTYNGYERNFSTEDIIFIKGFNPTMDSISRHRGISKIALLAQTLTRLKAGRDASVAQMQNGGVPGIVYHKTEDFNVDNIGKRKADFAAFMNELNNKGAPYWTDGELGYIALGLKLADLEVSELATIDFKKICNAYSISDRIFNNDATGSEISDDNANKGLYLNGTMPTTTMVDEELTQHLARDFKVQCVIRTDYSEVEVLQENMLQKMQALAAAPTMVPNEVRVAMGHDRSDDPLADILYIKQGYQPISDFQDVEPVEDVE